MTDATRQQALRERRRAENLTRLEMWVPKHRRDEIKSAVDSILAAPSEGETE